MTMLPSLTTRAARRRSRFATLRLTAIVLLSFGANGCGETTEAASSAADAAASPSAADGAQEMRVDDAGGAVDAAHADARATPDAPTADTAAPREEDTAASRDGGPPSTDLLSRPDLPVLPATCPRLDGRDDSDGVKTFGVYRMAGSIGTLNGITTTLQGRNGWGILVDDGDPGATPGSIGRLRVRLHVLFAARPKASGIYVITASASDTTAAMNKLLSIGGESARATEGCLNVDVSPNGHVTVDAARVTFTDGAELGARFTWAKSN